MIRIDFDNFFMSGSPSDLTRLASTLIAADIRPVFSRALRFLLDHQYIKCQWSHGLWRAVMGSGMGLRHSSVVCDAAVVALIERKFAVHPAAQAKFAILAWWRFRDDVFVVSADREKWLSFVGIVKQRCNGIFALTVEEISRTDVTMLAVDVFAKGDKLTFQPRTRDLDGPPLSVQSCHPRAVHINWQKSYLSSFWRLSSPECAATAAQRFIDRCQRFHSPRWLLGVLRGHCRFLVSCRGQPSKRCDMSAQHNSGGGRSNANEHVVKHRLKQSWITLPHHPMLQKAGIQGRIDKLSRCPFFVSKTSLAWGECIRFRLRLSWKQNRQFSAHAVQAVSRRAAARNGWMVGAGGGVQQQQ